MSLKRPMVDAIYLGWSGGGGDSHVKGHGCLSYLLGVIKVVLVSLRVSSLMSFSGPFRVLSRKNMTGDNVLF